MDRRTAVHLLMLLTFGFLGGGKVRAQEPKGDEGPVGTVPEGSLTSSSSIALAAPAEREEMSLEFTVKRVVVMYRGQEKKIDMQQLFDAL